MICSLWCLHISRRSHSSRWKEKKTQTQTPRGVLWIQGWCQMFSPRHWDLNNLKALREVVEQVWLLKITKPQITVCVTTVNEFLLCPNYKHINLVSATPSISVFNRCCIEKKWIKLNGKNKKTLESVLEVTWKKKKNRNTKRSDSSKRDKHSSSMKMLHLCFLTVLHICHL